MSSSNVCHSKACKGVIISDCHISSGDNCIALSSITNWEKPCEDIVITNCVLRSCSKAIVIDYIYSTADIPSGKGCLFCIGELKEAMFFIAAILNKHQNNGGILHQVSAHAGL